MTLPNPNVGPSSAPDTTCRGPDKEISTAEGCEDSAQERTILRSWAGRVYKVGGTGQIMDQGPKKHISISILWGYPYLNGLHYKGLYGISLSLFLVMCFWGPVILSSWVPQ